MFSRKNKAEKAQEQAGDAAHHVVEAVRDRVVPSVGVAALAAKDWGKPRAEAAIDWSKPRAEAAIDWSKPRAEAAKDWGKPHVEAARDWARPHVEHGIEVAAPKLGTAVAAAGPVVDTARDKLVDEVLPRIQAALSELSDSKGQVGERSSAALAALTDGAVGTPRRRGKGRILIVLGVLAALGAGVAAYLKKSQPKDDPWATPPSDPYVAPASTGMTTPVTTGSAAASSVETGTGSADVGIGSDLASDGVGTEPAIDAGDATGGTGGTEGAGDIRDVDIDALAKDGDDLDAELDESDVTRHRNRGTE